MHDIPRLGDSFCFYSFKMKSSETSPLIQDALQIMEQNFSHKSVVRTLNVKRGGSSQFPAKMGLKQGRCHGRTILSKITNGFGISCLALIKPHFTGKATRVHPGKGERILAGTDEEGEIAFSIPAACWPIWWTDWKRPIKVETDTRSGNMSFLNFRY